MNGTWPVEMRIAGGDISEPENRNTHLFKRNALLRAGSVIQGRLTVRRRGVEPKEEKERGTEFVRTKIGDDGAAERTTGMVMRSSVEIRTCESLPR